jgi:hypothetical protein
VAAGIAMYKTVDTNLNARPACAVFQRIDPVAIDLSLLYSHGYNVAVRLQSCKSRLLRL